MNRIIILLSLLLILLAGCKSTPEADQARQTPDSFTPTVEPKEDASFERSNGLNSLRLGLSDKAYSKKNNFNIGEIKFSLNIPEKSRIADYTKISRSLNIIDSKTGHSLLITIKKLGMKKFEDVKNEVIKVDTDVETQVVPWRKIGYEIIFKRPDIKKDYMVIINRTFLLPFKDSYFVLNEMAEKIEDNSLSAGVKDVAESLKIE